MVAFRKLSAAAAAGFLLRGASATGTESADEEYAGSVSAVGTCQDIIAESVNPECYGNVTWAMMTGIKTKYSWYANYTNATLGPSLNENSSRLDFQCALAGMVGTDEQGTGWSCPVPCSASLLACKQEKVEAQEEGSGLPWWGWLLILCPLLALCAGLAYYFLVMNKKEASKKKKKRAVKAPAAPAAPEPAPAPAPATTVLVAPPVYVSSAPAPVVTTAAPVYTAAPVQTVAAPVQTASFVQSSSFVAVPAAPIATYAAPVTSASYVVQP